MKIYDGHQLGDHGQVIPDNACYVTLRIESANLNISTALAQSCGWSAGSRIRLLEDDNGAFYLGDDEAPNGFLLSHLSQHTLCTNIGMVADMLRKQLGLISLATYRILVTLDAKEWEGRSIHRIGDAVMRSVLKTSGSVKAKKRVNSEE